MKISLPFLCSLSALLISCNKVVEESEAWRKQVNETTDQLKKELAETRKVASESAQSAIRAVPGERWLQIIDDLNGPDPEKKQAARSFLKNLANVDIESTYEVSAWFEFIGTSPLRADILCAPSPHIVHVQNHIQSLRFNPTEVASTALAKPTLAQISNGIAKQIEILLAAVNGEARVSPSVKQGSASGPYAYLAPWQSSVTLTWSDDLSPDASRSKQFAHNQKPQALAFKDEAIKELNAAVQKSATSRAAIAENLAKAILKPYEDTVLPVSNVRLFKPWYPLAGGDFLFVLIPEEDFLKHQNALSVVVLIHKSGDAASGYQADRRYKFAAREFIKPSGVPEAIDDPVHGRVVWAVHNMTDNSGITTGSLQKIRELKEILNRWNAEALAQ